ncbi:dimethyladenosine transferase 1, mitochondrial [Thrips palmi]|uniref:rRNA adenine N(6)-methyltransferase n=1 Tax=Thrips palmi TaxID=161013 RepID=A0A6P8ZX54_THRPL|nr:dimethyladenosine transferase 1, mitochondrial [Thrips palmi]
MVGSMARSGLLSMKQTALTGSALRLPPLPSPRDLIKLYKLRARKQLSQNFLLDTRITDKFAKSAGKIEGADVCEVGPGPGSITRSILKRHPGRLIVIEKDPRFLPFLQMLEEASQSRMNVVVGDVLSLDMSKMFRESLRLSWEDTCPDIHLIGNLPFSVSTPLIIRWLRDISLKQNAWSYGRVRMTLTFQKEVAERTVAEANGRQRCRLSVMCQNWCDVKHLYNIPGSAFVPPPEVDVGVVTFRPKIEPTIKGDFHLIEKVVRQMTCFRQKYCITCAGTLFPEHLRKQLSHKMLDIAEVNPETRAFQLTMDEFQRLVMAYEHLCSDQPKLFKYKFSSNVDEDVWMEDEDATTFTSTSNKEGLAADGFSDKDVEPKV